MNQDNQSKTWKQFLGEAGITNEFLLNKTNELIEAIETGKFRPKNKERELRELRITKKALMVLIEKEDKK